MEQIKQLYKKELSEKENLVLLSENGINISIATFRRYKKEMGLAKTYNKRPQSAQKQTDNKDTATAEINAQSTKETANNESTEGTNETANNEDREYNELLQKIHALKTENDIKKFDFNAYYDTLKRHDIIKMVATVNGFNAKEKALSLRETNYVAFMVFVQSKIKSNYDSTENAVLLKMVRPTP